MTPGEYFWQSSARGVMYKKHLGKKYNPFLHKTVPNDYTVATVNYNKTCVIARILAAGPREELKCVFKHDGMASNWTLAAEEAQQWVEAIYKLLKENE